MKEPIRNTPQKCNICGDDLDYFDLQQKFIIHKNVLYGSRYDLHTVYLQMCCDCFDTLVSVCEISPILGGDET